MTLDCRGLTGKGTYIGCQRTRWGRGHNMIDQVEVVGGGGGGGGVGGGVGNMQWQ